MKMHTQHHTLLKFNYVIITEKSQVLELLHTAHCPEKHHKIILIITETRYKQVSVHYIKEVSYQETSYTVRPWYPDRVQMHFQDKSLNRREKICITVNISDNPVDL